MRKQPRLTHHVLVSSSASESYAVEKLQNLNGELAPGADAVAERGRGDRALVVRSGEHRAGELLDCALGEVVIVRYRIHLSDARSALEQLTHGFFLYQQRACEIADPRRLEC